MSWVVTDDNNYKAIADMIRNKGDNLSITMKPSEMPNNIETVCEHQYDKGYDVGLDEGKQAEYDRFWDSYQQNGNRKDYAGAFGGHGWTADNFKPKYNIIVDGSGSNMFYSSAFVGDLAQHLEDLGVVFDTSKMTSAHGLFNYASQVTRLPEISLEKCVAAASAVFASCSSLVTIDKLVLAADNASMSGWFTSCSALENLIVEGIIGTTGLNLRWSTKLSKASITSVVNALSMTTSGLSVTFSKAAVNNAFTTDEWAALAATKTNWTINLV